MNATRCTACQQPGCYTILLATGPSKDDAAPDRFYLPNQHTRSINAEVEVVREHWFCADCMRTLEDSFRATLLYLQAESGLVTPMRFEGGQ